MDHGRKPAIGQRGHALLVREIKQNLPGRLLAFSAGADAGIHQHQLFDTLGRKPDGLHRDAGPEGVTDDQERAVPERERGPRHVGDGILRRDIRDGNIGERFERRDLRGPDGLVAKQSGDKDDLQGSILPVAKATPTCRTCK